MRKTIKVSISLPNALLDAVVHRQNERGESRSATIAYLLEAALADEQVRADVDRYVRGYLEQPETADEIALNDRLAMEAAARDPWP